MKIAVIGAGNAGSAIGNMLKKNGQQVVAVWSRDARKARKLALSLKARAYSDISQIPRDLDLYLVAIKDDEVRNLAAKLNPGKGTVAHLSGSLEMSVFKKKFRNYGVLWPVMTFSASNKGKVQNFPVVVNGNTGKAKRTLFEAGKSLSKQVYKLSEKQRASSHLAAVFANNFTNHMIHLAQKILKKNTCPPTLLNSLILETARLGISGKARDIQTGPAIRQDLKTMLLHRKLLKNNRLIKTIYKTVSQSIVKNKA